LLGSAALHHSGGSEFSVTRENFNVEAMTSPDARWMVLEVGCPWSPFPEFEEENLAHVKRQT
jgi:hypothetical protein